MREAAAARPLRDAARGTAPWSSSDSRDRFLCGWLSPIAPSLCSGGCRTLRSLPGELHASGSRFGSPASSESPVTLRPLLAEGLPFRQHLSKRAEWMQDYTHSASFARGNPRVSWTDADDAV